MNKNSSLTGSAELEFFGPSHWKMRFGINIGDDLRLPISNNQLKKILNEPCPFVAKKSVAETHFLFYLPHSLGKKRFTVNGWNKFLVRKRESRIYSNKTWYLDENFVKDITPRYHWYLIFRGIIPDSCNKTWEEQLKMIPETHEVPFACETLSMYILSNKIKHKGPQRNGRVMDKTSTGQRVTAGFFGTWEYHMNSGKENEKYYLNGIYAIRKLI